MGSMPQVLYAFRVTKLQRDADGAWWFTVLGASSQRHGPFQHEAAARLGKEALFRRWASRARALGGYCWRSSDRDWGVSLPEDVPCRGLPYADPQLHGASTGRSYVRVPGAVREQVVPVTLDEALAEAGLSRAEVEVEPLEPGFARLAVKTRSLDLAERLRALEHWRFVGAAPRHPLAPAGTLVFSRLITTD